MQSGRPIVNAKYSTHAGGEDKAQGAGPDGKPGSADDDLICPSSMGAKNQPPVAYSPKLKLIYIPGNHECMTYEPFQVEYTAGQPYVGTTLNLFPAGVDVKTGEKNSSPDHGSFTAWDPATGTIAWNISERFSLWGGVVATAGDVVIYGTLEGYLKVRDANTGAELYRFKTPSGIIGNVSTWAYNGKQYVGVLSGLGGWAGVGVADDSHEDYCGDALGCVHHALTRLTRQTNLGGVFTVFALPSAK
jgi:glucose dehydrogenase